MSILIRLIRQQFLGAIALVVALTGIASGAVPKYLQIGVSNDEPRTTGLRNLGPGPAMSFSTKPGQPPFSVDSNKVVAKLNAALLQGKGSKAFAPATGSPSYAPAGA